jgi:hypothetical protein
MMFDVDPTMSHSQQFPMISTDDEDDDEAKVEFSSCVRNNNPHLSYVLISCSPSSSLFTLNSPSVTSPFPSRMMSSLQFVIFLDLARSVDSSQSLMLDI